MPNTAKVSLSSDFLFHHTRMRQTSFHGGKKKSYYFQHWEIPSATAQPSQCLWLWPCVGHTQAHSSGWVCLCSTPPESCSATLSPGMLLPSPLPLAATTTWPGHGAGLQEHLGYFYGCLHSLLPRIFLEFVFSVWWENYYFHTSKNWNVFFP